MPSFFRNTALVLGCAVLSASLAVTAAEATVQTSVQTTVQTEAPPSAPTEGPSVIEVPIEDSLEVRPAAGWYFADCAPLLDASSLVASCSSETFTVVGPSFDPDIAPARVPMLLRSGGTELTVDYVIRLAEPTPPDAPDTTVGLPLQAGAVSLIPLSELGLDCGLCTTGIATIEVRGVDRDDLGTAHVTGTHLVFSAAPNVRGTVEVDMRVRDDIEKAGKTFKVMLAVAEAPTSAATTAFRGLHLLRQAGELELDASELLLPTPKSVAGAPHPDPFVIAGCGPAVHGTVRCTPGGTIHYTPPGDGTVATPDQFAVRLVAADGRQTIASVTFTDLAAKGTPANSKLVPAAGSARAKLDLSLPRPPAESDEESSGVTTTFTELMNELGAR